MRRPNTSPGDETAADLETWVRQAQAGSRDALERVVATVQGDVYGLALRFLWHPQDAEDASQEILVRIVTHLGSTGPRAPSVPGPTAWPRTRS